VGAVSALSTVRAFGIAFLGSPRDPHVHVSSSTPSSMNAPMLLLACGTVLLGLCPLVGFAVVRAPAALFTVPGRSASEADLSALLSPLQVATRALALLIVIACAIGWVTGRNARRHVTWGCGYTTGNSRMQYTGSSFAADFAELFRSLLPQLRREHLPHEIFPREPGRLSTHHVDGVEHRMFEVLGQGEEMISRTSERIPEEPRFAFAAGLVALVVVVGLLLGAGGR
jgi:hydrogenase-4 component B